MLMGTRLRNCFTLIFSLKIYIAVRKDVFVIFVFYIYSTLNLLNYYVYFNGKQVVKFGCIYRLH